MTVTDSAAPTTVQAPMSRVVEIDGIPMSALVIETPQPRAVIVAVHGGSTTSVYFDCPNHPQLSFMRVAAELGFTIIALDRPGYGSSAPHAGSLSDPRQRVELAYAATDAVLDGRDRGAGLFLMAHSAGCDLGIRMAVHDTRADLLGIELAGTGRTHPASALKLIEATKREGVPSAVRNLLWQPSHVYPPEIIGSTEIASPAPGYERTVVDDWASVNFAMLAARVRIPVHFSLAEYELVWRSGPAALADIATLFTASPRVVVNEQADSGHNLSLGFTARAYHLKVLSFIEECAVAHDNPSQEER